jgi:hypothetical protein
MKTFRSFRLVLAGLCGLLFLVCSPVPAQLTGPQQLVFTGLRASSATSGDYAQFNGVQTDALGNIYLLLNQRDGIRLVKTDGSATNVLAQAHVGSAGDIGLAMAVDPSGNLYITGTTTSGSLPTTSGVAFPSAADTSTNSFIGKFDENLNTIFVTYAGSGRMAASAIAATADAVFVTGSIFAATLPVTPSGIIQSPAAGSFQNGFVERFNTAGTTLVYATYLSGENGDTAPSAIAADGSDDAYITGYTTSSGFPTLNALVPNIIPATLNATSGFLTKLTPGGDGLVFSTFIPGQGLSALAIDGVSQTLLLSGSIAVGQFPVAGVTVPLVDTTYQTLVRLPLDGSAVLASTLLAPGTQSALSPAASGATWVTISGSNSLSGPASLLPLAPLSTIGNSYGLRVIQQEGASAQIDETIRFGGLPTSNPTFASAPVTLTSLVADGTGEPIFAGSVSPTASSSLLATETYDLPLYNALTEALPSTLRNAVLPVGACTGSQCSGTAAYLAKINPVAAPSLSLSIDNSPNLTLRNLGSSAAASLQISAANAAVASDCPATLASGEECDIALTPSGSVAATVTVQAAGATTQSITLPTTTAANTIVFSPKELDFGIETSASPAATRTVTVTNLSQQSQMFSSKLASNQITPYSFAELSSDCAANGPITIKTLAPGASCHITLGFTASPTATDNGFAQSNWSIGAGDVLLTAYTQAAPLNLSATEIDFGTQYPGGIQLPRYLYLSNNSARAIAHAAVTLNAPFRLVDNCPSILEPHTVCRIEIDYNSLTPPTADSTTLVLDDNLTVLITGSTLAQPTGTGQAANPNLTLTPATISFPNPVIVTATSATTETVTVGNTGMQPFDLGLTLTGDFTFTTNCSGSLPGNSTCSVVLTFAPSQPGTRQGLLAVTAGSGTAPDYVSLSGTGTPLLGTSSTTLAFGNVIVGQPSVLWSKISQPFSTLTASTSSSNFTAILVEDIGYGHGQPASNAFTGTFTGSCTNCWLGVQFIPTNSTPQTATLTLTSTASGTPSPFTLTGTGVSSSGLFLTPVSEDFGPVPVNSVSAPTLFTLTNETTATITLPAPTTIGDFSISQAATGGAACTGALAPTASCLVLISFSPTAIGQRTGALILQPGLSAALSGYGSPNVGLTLSPTALVFNNVPGSSSIQQIITLTNSGSATLQIATPTTATSAFAASTSCTVLAPAATCTITVNFTPTNADLIDTLQIPVTNSVTGATSYTVPLSGAYTTEDAGLQIIPNQTEYGPTTTSTLGETRQFTINNLTAKSLTLDLALPRQFVLSGAPCSGLAPNASCNFAVTFLPLTNGDITGTLFAQATPTDGSATLNGLGYVEGYGTGSGSLGVTGNLIPNDPVLNFGQVSSGQSATQTLTLTNTSSTEPITVRRITSEWPFLVTAHTCGATLAPAQSCSVTLAYTPLNELPTGTSSPVATADAGSLVIESDALTSPDVIDLAGSAAPVLVASPANTAPLVSYTASQSSLAFALTQVGNESAPQTVTLSNTGTTTIHVTAFQTTSDFTVQSNCSAILPGASCVIYVSFTPQASTDMTGGFITTRISALEVSSDASTALDFISLLGTATPPPLTFTPIALNFGSVQVGSSVLLPIQVTNTSLTAAVFNGIAATGDYSATGTCPTAGNTLAATTSCTLQVSFTPTQPGLRSGTVSITNSLSTLPLTADLTGIGIQSHLQITPATLNFGSIAVGASANLSLALANTGNAPISSLGLAIAGDYAIIVPCSLTTLAPGVSCNVTVSFTPTALGPRPGSLTVTSSDSTSPDTVPLNGTGVPNGSFLLTVNGGSTGTATVAMEDPATYNLQLTPQSNFSGTVVLNCTPVTPGVYATCSLLPSSIALNGAPQSAIATINTITAMPPKSSAKLRRENSDKILLCLLPAAFFFFWNARTLNRHRRALPILWAILVSAVAALSLSGCGSGGDPNLLRTPPGTYQYQVTASSTTGDVITQTVMLNLTVTAQ